MKHIVSAAVITNIRGEFLLQFRDAGAPTSPNQWALFGGHKEGDETPLQTLARELKEELGLSCAHERFAYVDTLVDPADGGARISLYRLSLEDGEEKTIHLGEGGAYRFFPSKEEVLGLPMSPWQRKLFKKLI